MNCCYCKKPIAGPYTPFNGGKTALCPKCYKDCTDNETLFSCLFHQNTLMLIGSERKRVEIDGKFVDYGEIKQGTYPSIYVCGICKNLQVILCAGSCQRAIKLLDDKENKTFLNTTEHPYSLLRFCDACYVKGKMKLCVLCDTPAATASGQLFRDARKLEWNVDGKQPYYCSFCAQSQVKADKATNYFTAAYLWLVQESNLGITIDKPECAFLNDAAFQKEAKAQQKKTSDMLGMCGEKGGKYYIYIKKDLPGINCADNVAHELAHVWQRGRGVKDEPSDIQGQLMHKMIYEGFAVWCAYTFLNYLIGKTQKEEYKGVINRYLIRMGKNEDEIYGGGLQLFIDTENAGKLEAVMELVNSVLLPAKSAVKR